MPNGLDPDQTAPSGVVWSWSTLFTHAILLGTLVYKILGNFRIWLKNTPHPIFNTTAEIQAKIALAKQLTIKVLFLKNIGFLQIFFSTTTTTSTTKKKKQKG